MDTEGRAGRDSMRSKRVAIVHIAGMQAHTNQRWKHTAGLHHDSGKWEPDITAGLVRREHADKHGPGKRRWDGIGVGDGAWIRAGTGSTDGDGTDRGDGM